MVDRLSSRAEMQNPFNWRAADKRPHKQMHRVDHPCTTARLICVFQNRGRTGAQRTPYTRTSDFAKAIVADPVEIQAMGRNVTRHHIAHSIVEVILRRNGEVPHNATLFTNKMVVLLYGRVVSVKSFTEIEFANFPLRCKDVEVAVNCAEGYTWDLLPNLFMHPFRRRMRGCPR
jgi:hypothetical protein